MEYAIATVSIPALILEPAPNEPLSVHLQRVSHVSVGLKPTLSTQADNKGN